MVTANLSQKKKSGAWWIHGSNVRTKASLLALCRFSKKNEKDEARTFIGSAVFDYGYKNEPNSSEISCVINHESQHQRFGSECAAAFGRLVGQLIEKFFSVKG